MEGTLILKLAFLLVLSVAASPQARQKHPNHGTNGHGHHHGRQSSPISPPPTQPAPTPAPAPAPVDDEKTLAESPDPYSETPPIEEVTLEPPPPSTPSSYGFGVPAVMPPPGYVIQPYQTHGCQYPCTDSNDCDWPCTACCRNSTCCYDWPEDYP